MLDRMSSVLAAVTDPTVPVTVPSTVPTSTLPGTGSGSGTSSVSEVVRAVIDNLGHDGYQTGVALVVATVAVVGMLNIKVHRLVLVPVGVGAFWFGWLAWNTVTGKDNPLFPGDVTSTKIWDVAFTSDTGFLLVVGVACIAAVFLWRKGTALPSRVVMILGAVLGASFVYNLVEAVRAS